MLNARYLLLHQALGLGKIWLQQGARLIPPETQEKTEVKQEASSSVQLDVIQEKPIVLPINKPIGQPVVVVNGDLNSLTQQCVQCQACELSTCCKKPLFGQGNPDAQLLIFSACPTPDDDLAGQLFYGETGQFLAKMLGAINIDIETVYITTAAKCSGGFKKEVTSEHYQRCMPFLNRQIELVKPKAILALGSDLADWADKIKNELFYQDIPYFVISHPAKILRHPQEKRQAWETLQKLESFLFSEV
jgi:uracil-DNA glycosylase family 4